MAPGTFSGRGTTCRIAVVGAGAIGNAVLPLLATMPLTRLTIIDGDRVERKNLERQPLYKAEDVGRFKASAVAARMRAIFSGGDVVSHDVFLDPSNAHALLREHDVVVEGVDDLHAKTFIDRVCLASRVPLVSGAVHGAQAQVIVLHAAGERDELTRAHLFPGRQGAEQDGCDMRNVPLDLLVELGKCMAARVRDVVDQRPALNGRLELLDLPRHRWMTIEPVS